MHLGRGNCWKEVERADCVRAKQFFMEGFVVMWRWKSKGTCNQGGHVVIQCEDCVLMLSSPTFSHTSQDIHTGIGSGIIENS